MNNILTLILGGGRGTRLFPLTKDRSKPAVPIGGKYRIIDVPISNCIQSDLKKIYVVTQFNSKSLNHHINHTYRFDNFENSFVDILAAQQTEASETWYMGTADAVRRNLTYVKDHSEVDHVLILSGDQLYRMDYRKLINVHLQENADMTIATYPVLREQVGALGVMQVKKTESFYQVSNFAEKPSDPQIVNDYAFDFSSLPFQGDFGSSSHLASMGIYLFKKEVLIDILDSSDVIDFGHHIVPELIRKSKVVPYFFSGYWEDIGTIQAFHQANIDLVGANPKFNLYKKHGIFFTNCRYLPPPLMDKVTMDNVLVAEGAVLRGGTFRNSLIGLRSKISKGVDLDNVVLLGADYFSRQGRKPIIGENSMIKNAIIDKNVIIGKNSRIVNEKNVETYDDEPNGVYIRDGIVVIAKNSTLPDNFVL